ncbi:MAG: DUF1428 domain-containing protein [Alphaproteobacteria bacterium]|nr:DUF1428 domain-containing protein [Alphaproteobacteria bacterium]
MTYVDGFVLAVPKDRIEDYREMADFAGKIWMEHGALSFMENVIEDAAGNDMCNTFPAMFGTKDDELTVFSYITYESREHRDEVNAKVMSDPRMEDACGGKDMPFDPKRMAFGGFRTIVSF